MCQDCGCGDPQIVPVEVHERLLSNNDRVARHNREHFAAHDVLAINLMGSPGSGKTAILEAAARALVSHRRLGAVSGDLATNRDAERLRAAGIPAATITTGSACHLDAEMVHHALSGFALDSLDIFVIENVGNLVCPAIYDLGQALNIVALSVKYPVMFRNAQAVLITKIDLLPHLGGVSLQMFNDSLARVMPEPRAFPVSARTGEGIDRWLEWLETSRPRV